VFSDLRDETKLAAIEFVKPWNSIHLFDSKDPSYDCFATWFEDR